MAGMNDKKISAPHWRLACIAIICLTPTACSPSTVIEIDAMVGTEFPPDSVFVGTNEVSISSAFDAAGHRVEILEDESDVPTLSASPTDCISLAEIETLVGAHRLPGTGPSSRACLADASCSLFTVYAVVVAAHYHEPTLDGKQCDPSSHTYNYRGLMHDSSHRSSFVLFYPNLINANGDGAAGFLRTTLHETGHAFNLHHADQDTVNKSIMTESTYLGVNFPAAAWSFSAQSVDHLKNHPPGCVMPGTGASDSVHADHNHDFFGVKDCVE